LEFFFYKPNKFIFLPGTTCYFSCYFSCPKSEVRFRSESDPIPIRAGAAHVRAVIQSEQLFGLFLRKPGCCKKKEGQSPPKPNNFRSTWLLPACWQKKRGAKSSPIRTSPNLIKCRNDQPPFWRLLPMHTKTKHLKFEFPYLDRLQLL